MAVGADGDGDTLTFFKVEQALYVFGVAAAILAAIEGGILPPGKNARFFRDPQTAGRFELRYARACSARQDARLYGRRDARRYAAKHTRL